VDGCDGATAMFSTLPPGGPENFHGVGVVARAGAGPAATTAAATSGVMDHRTNLMTPLSESGSIGLQEPSPPRSVRATVRSASANSNPGERVRLPPRAASPMVARGPSKEATVAGEYDLLVIGCGPAGQKAAIQAAKLGRRAAIVERRQV